MHWLLQNEVHSTGPEASKEEEVHGAKQHNINQSATDTQEKAPSKQTGLSHDFDGTTAHS